MFGTKLRSWMETHIVRSRKKQQQRSKDDKHNTKQQQQQQQQGNKATANCASSCSSIDKHYVSINTKTCLLDSYFSTHRRAAVPNPHVYYSLVVKKYFDYFFFYTCLFFRDIFLLWPLSVIFSIFV